MHRTFAALTVALVLSTCQGPSRFQGDCSQQPCEAGLRCLSLGVTASDGGCLANQRPVCTSACSTDADCAPRGPTATCVFDCALPQLGSCVAPIPKD
jgi:hypothetical protein